MLKDNKRSRERERRRRKRKRYAKMQLKHSKRGIISCVLAALAWLISGILMLVSYKSAGKASSLMGSFAFMAIVFSGTGLGMAIRGLKERNKNFKTCKFGIAFNGLIFLILFIIFCRGLF